MIPYNAQTIQAVLQAAKLLRERGLITADQSRAIRAQANQTATAALAWSEELYGPDCTSEVVDRERQALLTLQGNTSDATYPLG